VLLAWAVSCDSYELHEDGTADILGAGYDTFHVDKLPAEIDLPILVRLLLMEDEQGTIDLYVLGIDAAPLHSVTYEIEADPGPNHRSGYIVSQTEALEVLGLSVEAEGVYSIELYVNGDPNRLSDEHRRSIFFNVREGLPE
jgi:hypothetical protein